MAEQNAESEEPSIDGCKASAAASITRGQSAGGAERVECALASQRSDRPEPRPSESGLVAVGRQPGAGEHESGPRPLLARRSGATLVRDTHRERGGESIGARRLVTGRVRETRVRRAVLVVHLRDPLALQGERSRLRSCPIRRRRRVVLLLVQESLAHPGGHRTRPPRSLRVAWRTLEPEREGHQRSTHTRPERTGVWRLRPRRRSRRTAGNNNNNNNYHKQNDATRSGLPVQRAGGVLSAIRRLDACARGRDDEW